MRLHLLNGKRKRGYMFKYITIDLRTIKGIKEAERLKNKGYNETESGYKTINGFDTITFEIPVIKK